MDVSPLDLSPRTGDEPPAGRRRRRGIGAWLLLAAVLAGIGFVAAQALGSASLYYRNADEAVAQRDELGSKRFRVQGTVEDDVTRIGDTVEFTIAFNDARVAVRHRGDPPDLFQPGIPVVLEGRWNGEIYQSDRILVKHSAEYKEANPDRVSENAP